jgi:RecB family exonuclease
VSHPSAIELCPGARAAEERLLELLAERRAETRADPRLLASPVRVIVSSRSLRLHVCERIAARLGATAGVAVQTLSAAAHEILERSGERGGGAEPLVEVLVRRAARSEPGLLEACEPFRDGYRPLCASVRDLLDAGVEPQRSGPLLERLAAARAPQAERERASAVVRVAGRVASELESRGGGRAGLLFRAAALLRGEGTRLFPARALYVHGFADLTGGAVELVRALLERAGGKVLLDAPPDPAGLVGDPGAGYRARLEQHLESVAGEPRPAGAPSPPPAIECFRAVGAEAEVREVARRLSAALAAGARPERLGVVARFLGPYRAALRKHLHALGIPFACAGARAPLDGPGARIHALVDLLEQGARAPVERWIDALRRWRVPGGPPAATKARWRSPYGALRLALRVLGARSLEELPAIPLDPSGPRIKLPLRRGLERAPPPGGGPSRWSAPCASIAQAELVALAESAARLLQRLARWPEHATLAEHLERFARMRRDLGWGGRDPEEQRVRGAAEDLAADLGGERLSRAEFGVLIARVLRELVEPPLAGSGGGVPVLEVIEARGRTFEQLFVLGLERGSFPRPVREDPLLGDDTRRALAQLLPDVPIKARGRDEERFLFAELVSAGARATLSWQVADDDGRARVVSPLLAGLLGAGGEERVVQVRGVHDPAAAGPRTAREAALAGGLEFRLEGHRRRLGAALAEQGLDAPRAEELAGVRASVLEALEDAPQRPLGLAPWLGFLGAQAAGSARSDPRSEPIFVTRFEALARCPWQMVLRKLLHLEPLSAHLERLPSAGPLEIGNVAHRVLERIAIAAGVPVGESLDEAMAHGGWRVEWPAPAAFDDLLYGAAREELEREQRPHPGHVRLVAECARGILERARDFLNWDSGRFTDGRVIGVEVRGRARVDCGGEPLTLDFQADRVERRDGHVVLSDYKTGRPYTADEAALGLAAGRMLQPATYVQAAGGGSARGRYLYFAAERAATEVGLGAGDEAPPKTLARALGTLREAWLSGSFFPRLEDAQGDEPDACKFCDVSVACLWQDSGARAALRALASIDAPETAALVPLFRLPSAGEPSDKRRRWKRKGKG